MEILGAIEGLAPVRLLKSSFYAYPLVNAAHILSIGMVVTTVLFMDLRLLGAFRALERPAFVRLMRRAALIAFAGAAATGLALFAVQARDYVENPAFRAKVLLLLLAGINLAAFRFLADGSVPARAAAGLSMALWLGVLVCGRFIGFV